MATMGLNTLGLTGGSLNLAPRLVLDGRGVSELSVVGDTVGQLKVFFTTGTPTYTLVDDAGGSFTIDGDLIKSAVTFDYEVASVFTITVSVSGTTPALADRDFTITVIDVYPINLTLPVITGTAQVGATLTGSDGTWDATPSPVFTYRWHRDGLPILYATSTTYVLTDADLSHTITFRVTAANSEGTTEAFSLGLAISHGAGEISYLSAGPLAENVAIGTLVGTLSVSDVVGTPTFAIDTPGTPFAINGNRIEVGTPLDYESVELHNLTISVSGVDPIVTSTLTVSVQVLDVLDLVINTVAPVVSGAFLSQGNFLSTTDGTWTGFPAPTFTYQWLRDGADIVGATSETYELVVADIDGFISARVTAINTAGAVNAMSNSLGPIAAGGTTLLSASTVEENSAVATVVGTLSATGVSGMPTWALDNDAGGLFTIVDDELQVAGDLDYEIASSHLVVVSATGTTPTVPQTPFTITVTDVDDFPVNTVAPAISGVEEVGEFLTTTDGTWTGTPTPIFTYQWLADDVPIVGATASTYFLTSAELGTLVTVTVTGTNTAGTDDATSAATGTITDYVPALKFNDKRNSQYAFLGWS